MSKLMVPQDEIPVTLQRKHKARLNHVEHTKQVTQAALDANAEIYRHGFSNLCTSLNEAEYLMEAFRVRHGNNPAVEAAHQNMAKALQAFNHSVHGAYGEKLLDIIKNIPKEPRDVGFWEEIENRIKAFLFDDSSPKQSKLDEIQILIRDAKQQLSSASKAHLQELKTVLAEMSG